MLSVTEILMLLTRKLKVRLVFPNIIALYLPYHSHQTSGQLWKRWHLLR